jgi:hypothetical protein
MLGRKPKEAWTRRRGRLHFEAVGAASAAFPIMPKLWVLLPHRGFASAAFTRDSASRACAHAASLLEVVRSAHKSLLWGLWWRSRLS